MRTKIEREKVEEIERALEGLPAYQADQVTKTEAVRQLLPGGVDDAQQGVPRARDCGAPVQRGARADGRHAEEAAQGCGDCCEKEDRRAFSAAVGGTATPQPSGSGSAGRRTPSGKRKTRTLHMRGSAH